MAVSLRKFLRRGVKVGLWTDSGGRFSSSILHAMRQALIASNARETMSEGEDKGLSIDEMFYLATLGGARVCSLADKVGNFALYKDSDACIISTLVDEQIVTVVEPQNPLRTVFEEFVINGHDRNITNVSMRGRRVK